MQKRLGRSIFAKRFGRSVFAGAEANLQKRFCKTKKNSNQSWEESHTSHTLESADFGASTFGHVYGLFMFGLLALGLLPFNVCASAKTKEQNDIVPWPLCFWQSPCDVEVVELGF